MYLILFPIEMHFNPIIFLKYYFIIIKNAFIAIKSVLIWISLRTIFIIIALDFRVYFTNFEKEKQFISTFFQFFIYYNFMVF